MFTRATRGRARPRKAPYAFGNARMHGEHEYIVLLPHDECTQNAYARLTPSATMPPPAGVSLGDGCSATRRETRGPFARRREAYCLPKSACCSPDGLPCEAVRSSSEKDARLVLADFAPYTSCY
ncbi:hypothetical protein Dimus_007052 [Dionaea muscipula]